MPNSFDHSLSEIAGWERLGEETRRAASEAARRDYLISKGLPPDTDLGPSPEQVFESAAVEEAKEDERPSLLARLKGNRRKAAQPPDVPSSWTQPS